MSVKIRLALTGKKHQISYRLVAQDTRSKRDGKFLEILGHFNPGEKDKNRKSIDKEKVKFWLAKGATFTKSAKYLFEKGELPPKPKKKVEPKKESAPKQESSQEETAQAKTEAVPQEAPAEQPTGQEMSATEAADASPETATIAPEVTAQEANQKTEE